MLSIAAIFLVLQVALSAPAPLWPALQPASAAECEGDDCQGPAPAPEDPTPGTAVVEGPPNPPVHYPKVHKKNPHTKGSHKRHQSKRRGGHR